MNVVVTNELLSVFNDRFKWASEIIPNQIYLGSGSDASNREELYNKNIKRILNVADDVPNYYPNNYKYLNLFVSDFGQDKGIIRVFPDAFDFLNTAKDNNETVLIHCAAGRNRSVTIIIAWLMFSERLSLKYCYNFIKSKRSVCLQKDMKLQLLEYELQLFGYDSNK